MFGGSRSDASSVQTRVGLWGPAFSLTARPLNTKVSCQLDRGFPAAGCIASVWSNCTTELLNAQLGGLKLWDLRSRPDRVGDRDRS